MTLHFMRTSRRCCPAPNQLDVVCICTPNGLHRTQAEMALEAGHHVVIEKPMALNRAEGERVLHKALKWAAGVLCDAKPLQPPQYLAERTVDSGVLGQIQMVQVNCFWNRDDRYYGKIPWKGTLDLDGGTLFTQFSHFIDIVYWLFGDMSNFIARFADFTHAAQHRISKTPVW